MTPFPKVNAHIHLPPNFSAFETVQQAVNLADAQDVRVLGVSNYYDFGVYSSFESMALSHKIAPLFGLEIIAMDGGLRDQGVKLNDPGNPGKMYLCGKGIHQFAPLSAHAQALLDVIRNNDSRRMAAMVAKIADCFRSAGCQVVPDVDGVKQGIVLRHGCSPSMVYLQERHIAQAFQECLFETYRMEDRTDFLTRLFGAAKPIDVSDSVAVQDALRSHLMKAGKSAFVEETFVDPEHAYNLVLALGGIPCYPILADGASPICGFEEDPAKLAVKLQSRGIFCAEFIPNRNRPEVLEAYVTQLHQAGMIVTAGTEHNTRDLIPMEPHCLGGAPIPDKVKEILWEGACVVAAHQRRGFDRLPGYVDSAGALNAKLADQGERISKLAEEGSDWIRQVIT